MSWLSSRVPKQNISTGSGVTQPSNSWLTKRYQGIVATGLDQPKPVQITPVQVTTPTVPTPQQQPQKSGLLNRIGQKSSEIGQGIAGGVKTVRDFFNKGDPIEKQEYQIGDENVQYADISEGATNAVVKLDERILQIEDEIVDKYYEGQKKLRIGIPLIGGDIGTPFDTPEGMKISKETFRSQLESLGYKTAIEDNRAKIFKIDTKIEKETKELAKERENLIATKELYNEILSHNTADTSFWEGLRDGTSNPEKLLPIIGTAKSIPELIEIYKVQNKKANNEPLSKYEESILQKKEAKAFEDIVNEKGFGYTLGSILVALPTFGAEFLLTGGIGSGTSTAVSKLPTIAKITSKAPWAGKLISGIAGATAQTTLGFSQSYTAKALEYAIDKDKTYSFDEGLVVDYAGSKEDLNNAILKNLPKAYGVTWMEVAGEKSGEGLTYIGKGIMAKYLGKHGVKTLTEAQELIKKTGWDGIVAEVFEEELTYAGQSLVEGTDYKAPGLSKEANERLLLEVLSIGIYGSILKTGETVANRNASKQAENTLREEAKKQGISDEEVNAFILELKNAGQEQETEEGTDQKTAEEAKTDFKTGTEAVTLYRGLNEDRPKSEIPYEEGVTFYTTDRATAEDYSGFQTDDRIKDLEKKKTSLESSVNEKLSQEEVGAIQKEILGINDEIKRIQREINENPESIQIKEPKGKVEEIQNPLKNPLVVDAGGKKFDEVTEDAIKKAKAEGKDGVVINNVIDAISKENAKPITTVIVFDGRVEKAEEPTDQIEITAKIETEEKPQEDKPKDASPEAEISGVNEINEVLLNNYGKDIKTATKKQILETSVQEPVAEKGIEYDSDISKKFGKTIFSLSELGDRPSFIYGGLNNNVFTNGYVLITDEVEARKINTKVIDQQKTKDIKDLTKSGMTFPEATAKVKKESDELIEKYEKEYPKWQDLIPDNTKDYTEISPKVIFKGHLILAGEDIALQINPDYYQYVMNNLKIAKVLAKDGNSAVLFLDNADRIKALVMPITMNKNDIDKFKGIKKGGQKSEASEKPGSETEKKEKSRKVLIIYRGETGQGGNYYTEDKEYASEFANGKPLLKKQIMEGDIYRADPLPEATSEKQVDDAIKNAKKEGYKAVFIDEGKPFGEQVESIFIIDKDVLMDYQTQKPIKKSINKKPTEETPFDKEAPKEKIGGGVLLKYGRAENVRWWIPATRGIGWTKDKIKRALRNVVSSSGKTIWNRSIKEYNNDKDLMNNVYYHGSQRSVSKLKPSIVITGMNENDFGGGYGERYWGISLSKERNTASIFTGTGRSGAVAPVILRKSAKVIEMPNIEDAVELEDHIEKLWNDGVDAVKIGDWNNKEFGEKEIVILNPKAIVTGENTYFQVYGKPKFSNLSLDEIKNMYPEDTKEEVVMEKEQPRAEKKSINKTKKPSSKTKADEGVYADAGDYGKEIRKRFGESYSHIKAIEMPELVQLVKDIMGGKTPLIKKFRMDARGFFRPATMDIVLRPELFEDPTGARKTLAHEIGHLIDYLPDLTMKRGNILGRIATLRGYRKSLLSEYKNSENVILTKEDRDRLKKEARKRVKQEIEVTEEVVTGEAPIDPKDVLDIWNDTTAGIKNPELLSYISKLSSQEKKAIIKQAMKGEIPAWVKFKKQIKETITRKVIKNSPADVKKAYNDLVKEEIIKRKLFEAEVIRKELISLSAFWKPFDRDIDPEFTAYRDSGEELYADALSVLFNDPVLLKQKAPNFMTGFFNYLDEKPEVAKAFTELQDMLNAGNDAILQRRNDMLNDMYKGAEDKYVAKEIDKRTRKKSIWTEIRILLDTKNARVYQDVNKVTKLGGTVSDKKNPKYLLEELPYNNAFIKNKIENLFQEVKTLAESVDGGWVELGKILQMERSINERGELANPGGFDPKTAQDTLDYIESQHSKEDWNTLQKAKNKFRQSMQDVIEMAEEGGYYKPELIAQMKANQSYATYQVIEYLDTYISPAIHGQVGTFKDIANPATSSVMKVASTLKAIERNTAKREVVDFYLENFPESVTKAPTRWNGKFHEVVEKKVPKDKTLVKIIRDGQLEGYYVDSEVGIALNGMSQELIGMVAYYAKKVTGSNFYRSVFTGINIGFQTTNLRRDFARYWKNMPDKTIGEAIRSFFAVFRDYGKAVKPAWDRARNKQNDTIKAMEDLKILDLNYNNVFSANEDDLTQIDRTFRRLGLDIEIEEKNKLRQAVQTVADALTTISNFIEGLPKIAGYEYLKGQGMEDKEMASFIRTMLGSPNFREGGLLTPITNNLLLFSNAIKEGYKTDIRPVTNKETRGVYFFKTFIADILPKLIMLAIAGGLLGDKFKKMLENVSEYNKTSYTIIPLGVDENGKTIYLRIPHDESGRLVGGLVWKSLNLFNKKKADGEDIADLFSFYAGQVPSLAPSFTATKAIMQYLSGQNPYDEFRNRNIIPDLEYKAGYKYSFPIFLDWLIKNQGGGIILPSYKPSATEVTNLEKAINLPVVSNILGRWLQVSDYGKTEQYQDIREEVDQRRAIETLEENKEVENAYNAYKKGNKSDEAYNEVVNDMLKGVYGKTADELNNADDSDLRKEASNTIKKLNTAIIRGKADPEVNALISAGSNEAKAEMLDAMLMEMKADEIQDFLSELLDQKIISADVLEKYQELNK